MNFIFLNNKTQFEFIVSNYSNLFEKIYDYVKKAIHEEGINQFNIYSLSQSFLENQYKYKKKRGRKPKTSPESHYGNI